MKIVKKVLSLLASSLAVLIFSGFLSLQPISEPTALAHDTDNPACRDITGVTQDIPAPEAPGRRGGIPDSGNLDFDTNQVAHDFQACTQTQPLRIAMRGWTWNTNLGFVSFSCQGGDNFGGGCGDTPYETVVQNDGRVTGFAWGDNIGWISMGCRNGDNEGVVCGDQNGDGRIITPDEQSVNYGVHIMQAGDVGNPDFDSNGCTRADGSPIQPGDIYGFAWTDTVGWINFCGARADVTSPLQPEVIIEGSNPPGVDAGAGEGPVYANGSDFYKVIVRVMNGDTPLTRDELSAHSVRVQGFVWNNTLRGNQVTRCSPADTPAPGEALPACAYNGSLPFPASLDSNNFEVEESGIAGYVRAIAPTGAADSFALVSFDVVIDGINYQQELNRSFVFLPAAAVTRVYSPDTASGNANEDSIFAQRNVSTEHIITAEFHPGSVGAGTPLTESNAVTVFTQLHDCSDAFDFVFDEGGVGVEDESGTRTDSPDRGIEADRSNIDRSNSVCPGRAISIADIDMDSTGASLEDFLSGSGIHRYIYSEVSPGQEALAGRTIETDDALGIQTRVQYAVNGITVRYFSKRVTDSSLLNQAADVKGNVRIDVQNLGGLLGGRSEKSIGAGAGGAGISKSEFFNRALDNLKFESESRAAQINSSTIANGNAALNNGEHFYKRPVNGLVDGDPNEPCKIIFQNPDATDINWVNAKTTIASRGCDIYINSNLMPSGANAALGIVALEDLDMPKDAPRKGGNVYICATVTDLKNVHIVAENSVLPYGELDAGGNIACGDLATRVEQNGTRAGLPKFDHPVREVLRNQLVITGSIVSNNTSGGAFKSPPEAGDGRRITNAELMDTARFYDYNFFRYAHTVTNPDPRTLRRIPKCWADNVLKSRQYDPYSCPANNPEPYDLTDNPGSKGIMNIQFAPPPNDLPVFNYKGR